MSNFVSELLTSPRAIVLGITVGTITPMLVSIPSLAQQMTFSDVKSNYWAQPFIQKLASQNIIAGYPDGSFKPEQPVKRDEFAAMIRDAFNQNRERQIPSGSTFKDVPAAYWAAPAIEEAYEAKFMNAFPNDLFRPRQEVSRLQGLQALVRGLNLSPKPATAKTAQKPKAIPLAVLSLMQPAVKAISTFQSIAVPTTSATAANTNRPSVVATTNYYQDAAQIPQDSVDEVAAATQANIVVNYPNTKVFNPNQPLTRGTAAAMIHQALVREGRLASLPSNSEALKYVVRLPSDR